MSAEAGPDAELIELRAKFRSFVSHATGGRTTDISLSLNTLSVMATQKVNDAWNMALEKGQAEAASRLAELQAERIRLREALTTAESEARRYAEFYPAGSDGRNTLVMLADKIAALSASPIAPAGVK